jgi:hypothetical protein
METASRAVLGNSPRTVLLRCVAQSDAAQTLIDRLGLVLPRRMRLAERELPALDAKPDIYHSTRKCSDHFFG